MSQLGRRADSAASLSHDLEAAFPRASFDAKDMRSGLFWNEDEYRAALRGKDWTQLDRGYFEPRADAMLSHSVEGVLAILPFHLRSVLEDGLDSPTASLLVALLMPPPSKAEIRAWKDLENLSVTRGSRKRFAELTGALTDAQRTVVAGLLQLLGAQDPDARVSNLARKCVDRYWRAFLPTGTSSAH